MLYCNKPCSYVYILHTAKGLKSKLAKNDKVQQSILYSNSIKITILRIIYTQVKRNWRQDELKCHQYFGLSLLYGVFNCTEVATTLYTIHNLLTKAYKQYKQHPHTILPDFQSFGIQTKNHSHTVYQLLGDSVKLVC